MRLTGEAFVKSLREFAVSQLIGVMEKTIFSSVQTPRRAAAFWRRNEMAEIAGHFDEAFYLGQIPLAHRRAHAARAPLLHYLLVGRKEHRAPNPRFDSRYYREATPEPRKPADPFTHYLRFGRAAGVPRNEAEAARREAPWTGGRKGFALVLHHARGGGSSRLLTLYEAELIEEGVWPLRLRGFAGSAGFAVCEDPSGETHAFDLYRDRAKLAEFAKAMGVTMILVSHVIDMPDDFVFWIMDLAGELDAPYDVVLHDYFAVCPRVTLVDADGEFCDAAPVEKCAACVARAGGELEGTSPAKWRADFAAFLATARRVLVPSHEMAQRLAPHVARPMTVWAPQDDSRAPPLRRRPVRDGEPLRVAIIGALTPAKGGRVVRSLALRVLALRAPIALTVVGPASERKALEKAGVEVLGRYVESGLPALLAKVDPHVVFVPAVWPETWSFILTHALDQGLPVAAFDIGAPAERLRALGREDLLLPLETARDPQRLMQFFLDLREGLISG